MTKKPKTKVIKEKLYWIDFYNSSGHCYRSRYDCTKEYVDECRKMAKITGEKIKVELWRVRTHEYTI